MGASRSQTRMAQLGSRISSWFLISFLFLGDENLYGALCFDDSEFEYVEGKDNDL